MCQLRCLDTTAEFLIQKVQGEDSATCVSQKFQMLLLLLAQGR